MNTFCLRLRFLPCLLLLLLGRVDADLPSPPAPKAVSLAEALTAMPAASVPHGSAALTVQPEWVMPIPSPPLDAPADDTVATPDSLAERYGRSLQVFSHVIALAPPTMTVLATNPEIANREGRQDTTANARTARSLIWSRAARRTISWTHWTS